MTRSGPVDGQGALFRAGGRPVARVRKGFDDMLRDLRRTDRLGRDQADLIALGRTIADAVDREWTDPEGSRFTLARLAAELRAIDAELKGLTIPMASGDPFGPDGFAALRDPAQS